MVKIPEKNLEYIWYYRRNAQMENQLLYAFQKAYGPFVVIPALHRWLEYLPKSTKVGIIL